MNKLILGVAMALCVSSGAQASSLISGAGSLAGANPINLPAVNLTGAGPVDIGGVSWTSTKDNSLFGWTGGYAFGNGTVAPGDPPIMALNAAWGDPGYATMTLKFDTPTAGVLAELFWTDNEFTGGASGSIFIYDKDHNMLDYWALNNNGNSIGMKQGYYGFQRDTADIVYVNFNNSHIGARNLSYLGPMIGGVPGVPEPASWAQMTCGLAIAGGLMRGRRRLVARLSLA